MYLKSFYKFLLLSVLISAFSVTVIFGQSKKNARPQGNNSKTEQLSNQKAETPVYFYEFSQPEFMISKIYIEHDENGLGKVTFQKKDYEDSFSEPLKLSKRSLKTLKELWTETEFLTTDKKFQSDDHDYGHLGTTTLKLKKNGAEKVQEFNWTKDLKARELAHEYRKLGNQYVWVFDMKVSGENQPLESPKIMMRFDKYLQRNEISDPRQMIPFLQSVSSDERFPLITRNHATRLMKKIEKNKDEKEPEESQ